jgi:ABC-type transport system substrate-binding protein
MASASNAAGQRLSLEYMTTAGNKLRELIQQVLQNQWKQIGVEVVIKNVPARTYFGETLKKQQFTALAQLAWSSNPEEPPTSTLASSAIPTAANNYGGANYSQFSDPTMDKLDWRGTARTRPRQTQTAVGADAENLHRRTAGATAVLPHRCLRGSQVADRRGAPRQVAIELLRTGNLGRSLT